MKPLTLLLILLCTATAALAQRGRGNRYIDAYKDYSAAKGPIPADSIKNYVYFAREGELIHDHPFLKNPRFEGAQIMYSWAQLEPQKDRYDFSPIEEDLAYLARFGKRLFIQLQDATFSTERKGVPSYLLTEEFDGGTIPQRDDGGKPEGWVAKRWNKNVQDRFAALLNALGKRFDGRVEGINLQETAIGVSHKQDSSFSPSGYVAAVEKNMLALKRAFTNSTTMQYANFMPGEWLPRDDKGYLRSVYRYGDSIGVGLGAPDLMVQRIGQLNHPLAMMHEHNYTVPLGIAVQDGNYIGETGSDEVRKNRSNIVPMLYAFARNFLKVKYIFWSKQEPYFSEDVLTALPK